MKRIFLLILTLSLFNAVHSQTRHHVWIDYYNYLPISQKFLLDTEFGIRLLMNDQQWQRYNIRNAVIYQLNEKLSFKAAINFHDFSDNFSAESFEIRFWQGIKFALPVLQTKLNNQVRYEERFFHFHSENSMIYCGRFRYEFSTNIPISTFNSSNNHLYVPLSEEILLNVGSKAHRFPHQNRMSLGIGYVFNEKIRSEIIYVKQHTRRYPETAFLPTDNLYRFKFRYYWN